MVGGEANKSQIWMMNLPAATTRRLTASPEYDMRPVLTADGSLIAYRSQSATGDARIIVITANGAPLRTFADTIGIVWDWSPDNRALLVIGPKKPPSAT